MTDRKSPLLGLVFVMKRFLKFRDACLLCASFASFSANSYADISANVINDQSSLFNHGLSSKEFFQKPNFLNAKLSPTGDKMAITTSKGADRVGLFIVNLKPALSIQRIAQFQDLDVVNFEWVNEDRLIYTTIDLKTGTGEDYRTGPGLVSVKADGTETQLLISKDGRASVGEGRGRREVLEPNHVLLRVPTNHRGGEANEVIVGRLNIDSGGINSVTPLWLNVTTGRTRSLDTGNSPRNAVQWWFDSAGNARVAATQVDRKSALHVRHAGDSPWKMFYQNESLKSAVSMVEYGENGEVFISFAPGDASGEAVLTRFDFAKMQPDPNALLKTPGFDFNGSILWSSLDKQMLGVRFTTDAEDTLWLDPKMKAIQADVDKRLPGQVNRIECRRCGSPDMIALIRSYSDRNPGEVWLYEHQTKRLQSVMKAIDGLDPSRMSRVEFHRVEARDGKSVPVWLTVPNGIKPGAPAPAVVMVHGGPWVRGGSWQWRPMEQFLASRGFLVISPEFRGSTGFGRAHFEAGWKQWGQAMQDDVADALKWAQKRGVASESACIAGASYGGYSVLMGLIRHSDLYKCGISWVAVTDLELLVEGSVWVRDDSSAIVRGYSLPELVGDAKSDRSMLVENSPVRQAERIKAPLFLAFGEDDLRVPLAHGLRMRDALIKAGNPPAEWVVYPGEGHGWRKQSNQVDFADRISRFLDRILRSSATKVDNSNIKSSKQ